MDGNLIDRSNYTAKECSTIITLKASYLNTLSAGTNTVEIFGRMVLQAPHLPSKQIPLITVITTRMTITIAIPLMTSHRVELIRRM